jgi:PAS domain S-box-containing protein
LRQSEARFRAMFDNVAVGMALMGLDRKVLQINQTAERIIGYSMDEARQIIPADLAIPDDRNLDQELFQELITGQSDNFQIEKRYRHKDGHIFWGRVTYSSVRDQEGKPQYLIGLIEDIDEEKRTQEKLADQEIVYRRILEQRVAERTIELRQANEQLQHAIEQRQKAEAALAQKAADDAVVAERNRLARDLHDAVTQTLFSASLIAEVIPQLWDMNPAEARRRLNELRELTRGALAEMRTLLLELRPSALTDSALPDLLRQLTEAIIGRARLPIQLTVEGDCALPPEVQVALYRIAQEALNNTVKYARATQVSVNLRLQSELVRFSVIDDGAGFDPAAIPPNHLGLRIMRERAEVIGAKLNIYSEPGEGTQVTVLWHKPGDAESD